MEKITKGDNEIYTSMIRSGRENSSVIMDKDNLLLVDCGVGPRILELHLNEINRSIGDITGAVITHSHFDHMKRATLKRLALEKVPVYCNNLVKKRAVEAANDDYAHLVRKNIHGITVNKEFCIGEYRIKAFNLKHDSEGGCHGYVFKRRMADGTKKIVYATDFGYPSDRVRRIFRNSEVIFIESDHCDILLDRCDTIPEDIKEDHIRKYHISNNQCCQLLEEALKNSKFLPEKIHLLHISDNINTEKKALMGCKRMLRKNGLSGVKICV